MESLDSRQLNSRANSKHFRFCSLLMRNCCLECTWVISQAPFDPGRVHSRESTFQPVFTDLAKTHGNVFTLWFGQMPIIILNGFEAVKEGLTAHPEDVSGRPTSPFFERVGNGKGIIFGNGHVWKQHRPVGAMGLKFLGQGKSGLEHQIQEEAFHLMEVFDSTKGRPTEPSFHITLAVSNVICALLFGYRFSSDDETFHQLIKSIKFILQIGASVWQNLYDLFPRIMRYLPGPHQKAVAFADFLLSFAMKEISSHEKNESLNDPRDFIDFYLAQMAKSKDDPTSLDENNLANSIFDSLFISGKHNNLLCQRVCLGENLARMELFLFFANLLSRFHFQLPEGVPEVNTNYIKGMTLQPHPQMLRALPR
ncbi:LOW QUALITY PROTEIN: cytochrome P450 2C28-like [Liasis olivaceus]